MSLARGYDLVIVDLDGVVYVGEQAVAGVPAALGAVADQGIPIAYATNNASRSPGEVARLLRSLGVPARDDEVLTSGGAAARLLADNLPAGARVLVVGSPALREEIRSAGLTPVARADDDPVAVVQGYGPHVGYADLAEGCVALRRGARWVATNTDATLPSPRGPLPGNGSLVAALSTALGGRRPDIVVGKPSPTLFEVAARRHAARRVLVVGDRLDTDIEGAHHAGADSLLVLTGVTRPRDVLNAALHQRPTFLAADCTALSTENAAAVRVPQWRDGSVQVNGWHVTQSGDELRLSGDGDDAVAALRALAAAAWAIPSWRAVTAENADAMRALGELGLVGAPDVRAASAV